MPATQQEVAAMTVSSDPHQIKQIVLQTFQEFGAEVSDSFDLNETLLLHDGHYFARSYRAAGLMAMWFVDNGFVQFYDADGNMLRTVNLQRETGPQRKAA
jgi:hypothetical protein